MIEIEVKTGKHTMDYEIEKSVKMVTKALQEANVSEGKFLLCLMDKTKGSAHWKGARFIHHDKNCFHGTIQTGDRGTCYKFNLIVPEEINSAHLISRLSKKDKKKAAAAKPDDLKIPVLPTPAETSKIKQLFNSRRFFKDEDKPGLLSMFLQEKLSSKQAKIFSVTELRELMMKQGFISEAIGLQSIWNLCQYAVKKNLFKKVPRVGKTGKNYALTEEYLALGRKDGEGKTLPIRPALADVQKEQIVPFGELYVKLENLSAMEKEKLKILEDTQKELKEIIEEKEKIKNELKNIIDNK